MRTGSIWRAAPARCLTLGRFAAIPLFLWMFVLAVPEGGAKARGYLLALYLYAVLSDLLDGPLARRWGVPSPRWARLEAAADILFNFAALSAAAGAGYVTFWVPAGVAALGGRFLWGAYKTAEGAARGPENPWGKAAGVLFYLLVGAVVFEISILWRGPGGWAGYAGDGVFLYTCFALWRIFRAQSA